MRIHALLFFFFFSQQALALYGARSVGAQRHLVKLQVNDEVFCQGVVIAKNKVLTTAHCIVGMGERLRSNEYLLTYYPDVVRVHSGKQVATAKEITIAPTYFDSHLAYSEDLALLTLSTPLTNAQIFPFANRADLVPGANLLLTASGQEASVKLRLRANGLGGSVIISEGSASGVCQGDSGGALLLVKNGKKYLAGILSAQAFGCQRRHSVSYFPKSNL